MKTTWMCTCESNCFLSFLSAAASISGSSSYTSMDDLCTEGDHLCRHMGSDENVPGYIHGLDIIKEGILKRKLVRHNGVLVSVSVLDGRCMPSIWNYSSLIFPH